MRRAPSLLWLLLVGALGCSDAAAPAADAPELPEPTLAAEPQSSERAGSLSLGLTLAGARLDSFTYAITGPSFSKAASVDVSGSNTVSVLVDGIPAGSGYSVSLSGNDTKPTEITCSGSAAFAIVAGEVTDVPVVVSCQVEDDSAPPVAASVPLPPLTTIASGLLLLALGASRRRRAKAPGAAS